MTSPFTCGLDAVLFVMGGKWKPLILYHLMHGALRYGELRRAVGKVSDKVLIQQLKELQADGIIDRLDFGEIPPKVEYSLTSFGSSLAQALVQLCEWGTRHTDELTSIVKRRADPSLHSTVSGVAAPPLNRH
ncbi:transcriptional regulator [Ochrobactrum sp. MYb29]|uniref:winged helix-turn-helix transcriptional regulator n=1 Tax=Brucella pituitosa TaxID=571256 RepID=UPI000C279765|nr:helix-turn-helix domain-containing protein [Brucella pituitosa]PJO48488.1 transcriptional regulator [Brucella pituitosa]PRA84485.1 transcriptional regulator [Ochrobactrum sp. MYb29]